MQFNMVEAVLTPTVGAALLPLCLLPLLRYLPSGHDGGVIGERGVRH